MLTLMLVLFGNTSFRKQAMSKRQHELPICMAQLVNVESLVGELHSTIETKTELWLGNVLIVVWERT